MKQLRLPKSPSTSQRASGSSRWTREIHSRIGLWVKPGKPRLIGFTIPFVYKSGINSSRHDAIRRRCQSNEKTAAKNIDAPMISERVAKLSSSVFDMWRQTNKIDIRPSMIAKRDLTLGAEISRD